MLDRALALRGRGPYVIQAAIASLHADEPRDWAADRGALRRALAADRLAGRRAQPRRRRRRGGRGPRPGSRSSTASTCDDYRYLHSTRGELLRRLGRTDEARAAYRRALELSPDDAERRLLERRLAELARRERFDQHALEHSAPSSSITRDAGIEASGSTRTTYRASADADHLHAGQDRAHIRLVDVERRREPRQVAGDRLTDELRRLRMLTGGADPPDDDPLASPGSRSRRRSPRPADGRSRPEAPPPGPRCRRRDRAAASSPRGRAVPSSRRSGRPAPGRRRRPWRSSETSPGRTRPRRTGLRRDHDRLARLRRSAAPSTAAAGAG